MKFLILFCVAVATCSAFPGYYYGHPTLDRSTIGYTLPHIVSQPETFPQLIRPLPPAPVVEQPAPGYPFYGNQYHKQYHNQDVLGQYNFAYETSDNTRSEARDAYGHVVGSYTYVDAEGKLQTVNYRADEGGFNVAGTNIPDASSVQNTLESVKESPEVAAAREAHLQAHEDFKAGKYVLPVAPEVPVVPAVPDVPEIPVVPELVPIEDEPEVAAAKNEFFGKYNAQVELLKKIESGEEILTTVAPIALEGPAPVTDEPAVALAKKEHNELHQALSEHHEILKKLTPEPVEYNNWPYTPFTTYPYGIVPSVKSVSPIVAEAKLHEPLITPALLPHHEALVTPHLYPQPAFYHRQYDIQSVSPIVAEAKLQEPLITPAILPHHASEYFYSQPIYHQYGIVPSVKSVSPIVAEGRLHEPLIAPARYPIAW